MLDKTIAQRDEKGTTSFGLKNIIHLLMNYSPGSSFEYR